MKLASYNCGNWYEGTFAPDVSGTFNLSSVASKAVLTGGPEGMVYIDATNPGFSADSVLVSEYSSGRVSAYQVDASGDPLPATRRDFLLSLNGAEGAAIDPLTGDFLFSTFGGGDRVIVVQGFNAPTVYCSGKTHSAGCVPTIQFTGAPALTGPDTFSVASQLEPNNVNGALVWGLAPTNVRFAGGNPGIAIDCSGKLGFDVKQSFFIGHGLAAGTSVYMQFLARDPGSAPPNNVKLSDALTYVIQPRDPTRDSASSPRARLRSRRRTPLAGRVRPTSLYACCTAQRTEQGTNELSPRGTLESGSPGRSRPVQRCWPCLRLRRLRSPRKSPT